MNSSSFLSSCLTFTVHNHAGGNTTPTQRIQAIALVEAEIEKKIAAASIHTRIFKYLPTSTTIARARCLLTLAASTAPYEGTAPVVGKMVISAFIGLGLAS